MIRNHAKPCILPILANQRNHVTADIAGADAVDTDALRCPFNREGKIRHVGISFHDRAEVLDEILREYPQIEVVQIQLNYVDFDDPAVQSRKCYEVCRKHGKPVIVMELVKGGNLVKLPDAAKQVFEDLHGGSPASYAIRFASGFPGSLMVLSGMSDIKQMKDNISSCRTSSR